MKPAAIIMNIAQERKQEKHIDLMWFGNVTTSQKRSEELLFHYLSNNGYIMCIYSRP